MEVKHDTRITQHLQNNTTFIKQKPTFVKQKQTFTLFFNVVFLWVLEGPGEQSTALA